MNNLTWVTLTGLLTLMTAKHVIDFLVVLGLNVPLVAPLVTAVIMTLGGYVLNELFWLTVTLVCDVVVLGLRAISSYLRRFE